MTADVFFNLIYQMGIILAVITLGMIFLHLFSREEEE